MPVDRALFRGQQVEAGGDGLELNRNIGDNSKNRNKGGNNPQPDTLAVTRRNEIRNGSDALRFTDEDDLFEQYPPKRRNDGRADVDR